MLLNVFPKFAPAHEVCSANFRYSSNLLGQKLLGFFVLIQTMQYLPPVKAESDIIFEPVAEDPVKAIFIPG